MNLGLDPQSFPLLLPTNCCYQIGMIGPFDARHVIIALSATAFSVGVVLVLYSKWIEQGGTGLHPCALPPPPSLKHSLKVNANYFASFQNDCVYLTLAGIRSGAAVVKKLLDDSINPSYSRSAYRITWAVSAPFYSSFLCVNGKSALSFLPFLAHLLVF
jgi:hypothetical protein